MCLLRDLHSTYVESTLLSTVRCDFDKHLYLTSYLNAHNHNTCIRLPQTGCTPRKIALFIIIEDRQTQQVLASDAMPMAGHGNHHNNRLKFMISVIIVTGLLLLVIIIRTV